MATVLPSSPSAWHLLDAPSSVTARWEDLRWAELSARCRPALPECWLGVSPAETAFPPLATGRNEEGNGCEYFQGQCWFCCSINRDDAVGGVVRSLFPFTQDPLPALRWIEESRRFLANRSPATSQASRLFPRCAAAAWLLFAGGRSWECVVLSGGDLVALVQPGVSGKACAWGMSCRCLGNESSSPSSCSSLSLTSYEINNIHFLSLVCCWTKIFGGCGGGREWPFLKKITTTRNRFYIVDHCK